MTGLLGLIVGAFLLVAIVAIFFLTIEKIVSDPLLVKIGKIVVGVIALVAVFVAAWGAFFGGVGGGGGLPHIDGRSLITFAVGLLIIIAVVYLLNMLIAFFGFMVAELTYLLSIVALIAVIVLAGSALFGGTIPAFMDTPRGSALTR